MSTAPLDPAAIMAEHAAHGETCDTVGGPFDARCEVYRLARLAEHMSGVVNRLTADLAAVQEALEQIAAQARQYAITARSMGHTDHERRWLDVLIVIERAPLVGEGA